LPNDDLTTSHPSRLAQALSIHPDRADGLGDAELAAILEHQLNTPLVADLRDMPEASVDTKLTFGQLLTGPQPPSVELLEGVKRFAKFCKSSDQGPLPRPIGTVLYFAAIVRALTHDMTKISALSEAALREGVHWSLAQAWVDGPIRELLSRGRELIDRPGESPAASS
jgi:hypothetical protein